VAEHKNQVGVPDFGRLSPPWKKGDLGGFPALLKSPLPPFRKGDYILDIAGGI